MEQTLETIGGKVVPLFKKLGVVHGLGLPDPIKLRFYMQALPGRGKTTYAASIPNSILLDAEDSAGFVENAKGDRVPIEDGSHLESLFQALISDKAKTYKHVVIDTIEKIVPHAIQYLTMEHNKSHTKPVFDIREYGQGGAGWGKVNEYVLSRMQQLYDAGYGWTVCGHLKEDFRDKPGTNTQEVVLRGLVNPGIRDGLLRDSQFVGMITPRTKKVKVGEKSLPGGKAFDIKEERQRWFLSYTSLDTGNTVNKLIKGRMLEHLPTEYDITGPNGWAAFEGPYCKAKSKLEQTNT